MTLDLLVIKPSAGEVMTIAGGVVSREYAQVVINKKAAAKTTDINFRVIIFGIIGVFQFFNFNCLPVYKISLLAKNNLELSPGRNFFDIPTQNYYLTQEPLCPGDMATPAQLNHPGNDPSQ